MNQRIQFEVKKFFSERIFADQIPCRIAIEESVELLLDIIIFYPTAIDFETIHGIPHSAYDRLLEYFLPVIEDFNQQWISLKTVRERLEDAMENLPMEFQHCTLALDGTDIRVWLRRKRGERYRAHFSHKFRKPAYRFQVGLLPSGLCAWVSDGVPASKHDKRQLDESNLRELLSAEDCLLVDLGGVSRN